MYSDYNMNNLYYGFNDYRYMDEYNYRNSNQPDMQNDEIITLNQAIGLIRQSIGDEKEDEVFYDRLIEQAPTEKQKEIITSIRDDERKHNNILRELYYNFTGQVIPKDMSMASVDNENSYKENLEKALFGELQAVTKYRKILGVMPSGRGYTLMMAIMTDELRHASKYNFLIQENK